MPDAAVPAAEVTLGLESRHVFLDTEVFKRRGHNLTVQPFVALGDYLTENYITLHTTDITLRELERQIRAEAADLASDMAKASKRIASWKHRLPHAKLEEIKAPDAVALGTTAWDAFSYRINLHWHAEEHEALAVNPKDVFNKYFDRHPPFQDHSSKEFPDAFVVTALEQWCEKNHEKMYVITHDKALLAAADASKCLLPLPSLEDFLQKVAEAETPEAIQTVEAILTEAVGVKAVREAVQGQFDQLTVYYSGDLHEGEVIDASFDDSVELTEFWIIAQNANTASVLVRAKVGIDATISYEDTSDAIYDKEEGTYFGAESAEVSINDSVTARVVLTIDLTSQAIEASEVLPDLVFVQEDVSAVYY